MQNWFDKHALNGVNNDNFKKLCDSMHVGDVIWYATLQNMFKMHYVSRGMDEGDECFGVWTESYDDESYVHSTLVGKSPKKWKPLKLILNCRFTSPDSYIKTYVFSVFGDSGWGTKYIWHNEVWNDISYSNVAGLPDKHCTCIPTLVDMSGNKRIKRLELYSRNDGQLVYLDEESCAEKCRSLNAGHVNREADKQLLKLLRQMEKQVKEHIDSYASKHK